MQIDKQTVTELAELISESVVNALEKRGLIGCPGAVNNGGKQEKTAYQKTEQLLYNYRGFKRIVEERMREIEEIRVHGVPQKCGSVGERVQTSFVQNGIVLPEESVENAVRNVQESVHTTVLAIEMIDKGMASLRNDPYYKILEMRYFDGRTQEDIALKFNCTQQNISKNKSRLVRELSMRLFPNQAVGEMLQ